MSKLIRKDHAADAYEPWQVPEVAGLRVGRSEEGEPSQVPRNPLTAQRLEVIQEQARQEAFEQGYQEGMQKAKQEIRAQVQRLEQLLLALHKPFEELDRAVESQLSQLAVMVARQLVRRELKTDPGQVVAVVREALAALPITSRSVRLYLHPEDAQLVREAFSLNEEDAQIQVLDDPLQGRGGCRVQTENSQIDATVESRLNAVIAQVLGGERQEDRQETP